MGIQDLTLTLVTAGDQDEDAAMLTLASLPTAEGSLPGTSLLLDPAVGLDAGTAGTEGSATGPAGSGQGPLPAPPAAGESVMASLGTDRGTISSALTPLDADYLLAPAEAAGTPAPGTDAPAPAFEGGATPLLTGGVAMPVIEDPSPMPASLATDEPIAMQTVSLEAMAGLAADPASIPSAPMDGTTGQTASLDAATTTAALTDSTSVPLTAFALEVGSLAATSGPNAIVLENQKQGNPRSEWDLNNGPSSSIEGFATDISYNIGAVVEFKINTDSSNYRIDIYRLGYYGGDGARKVGTIDHNASSAIIQPDPLRDAATGLVDAGNWSVTDSWDMPDDLVSGVYIAKLVREDGTEGENHIPFIVRDDNSTSDIVFQTSDTTWQAYNGWGGANLYGGNGPGGDSAPGRAYAVSYNRPITTREYGGTYAGPWDFVFGAEYSAFYWMEQNGYDVSYISGVDSDRYGSQLLNHKIYVSAGHDEYWSGAQRANVEAARDAGVSLVFMGGNDVYWRTRWEESIDGSGTDYRTLVSYKETRAGGKIDPSAEWTGTWRDLSADPTTGGGNPENGLMGTMFQVDSYRSDSITVPYAQTQLRFWRNTDVATTAPGESATIAEGMLGYEWDIAPDNGFDPAGLVRLSTTTINVDTMLLDYGTTVGPGTATHNLTLYRAESGALVFGAGTVYWSWGLADNNDIAYAPVDPNIQQSMVNLFADMGVQPETLQASLVLATGTTDFVAPTSSIDAPAGGGTVVAGTLVTLTGSAVDAGGLVAAVEISTDGGRTWWTTQSAPGNATDWTYTWRTPAAGTYTILTRAVDDSLNLEAPGAGMTMTVAPSNRVTLFDANEGPPPFPTELPATPTTTCCNVCLVHVFGPTELGVKFLSSSSGTISSVRFYKNFENTGPHVGSLWTADGTLLAQATFTSETDSGWQQVDFATPVAIAANTTYVASYHTTTGVYLASHVAYFQVEHTSGPLTALASAYPNGPNGLIAYGPAGTFPTGVPQGATNYWVDVVFNPASTAGNSAPVAVADGGFVTSLGVPIQIAAATLLANDSDPDGDPLGIAGIASSTHGTASYNPTTRLVTFTPEAGYTGPADFTYTLTDGRGGTTTATVGVEIGLAPETFSLFGIGDAPAVISENDPSAVELGVKFVASSAGTITGIRFYKGPQNTGTHTGSLWTASGTLLATATFTNETTSGWQQVNFASPVSITAGTTYVASYHTTSGYYSATSGYFNTDRISGPLTAPAGNNGLYAYGSGGIFPTSSFNNANYWVDVVFDPVELGPNQAPTANTDGGFVGYLDTPLTIAASALLANDSDPDGDTLTINGVVSGSRGLVSYNAATQTITFMPEVGYTGPASFGYTVSDGRGGLASSTVSVTIGAAPETVSLFGAGDTPAVVTVADPSAVELGVRFVASVEGTITGIRFYKGPQNTGTHTGSLWTASGTLLASATFTNETTSGWQQVNFASPVSITAGTTYVASYHTTSGYYSATSGYFNTDRISGPLTAPAGNNGVYAYGSGGVFPTGSFGNTNYWVDVVFDPTEPAANQAPLAAADGGLTAFQGAPLAISAATLLANDSDPDGDALTITSVTAGSHGSVSFDAATQTVFFTPEAGYAGPADFTYTVSDGRGGSASAQVGLQVVQTLFTPADVPAIITENDPSAVELGVKFTASASGAITGIRFYKGPQNTGTHTGSLWTASGTLLASATFTNETASGWQQVDFAAPVSIAAGTVYVASYHTTNGFFSRTENYFTSDRTNGPLTAPAGANGVYAYGNGGIFPTASYNSSNYWVDAVFVPASAAGNNAPVATADAGLTTSLGAPLRIAAATLLGNDSDPDGDPLSISGVTAGNHGTVTYDAATQTVTFTPEAGYTGPADFTYTITDGRGGTAGAQARITVNPSLFSGTDVPAIETVDDSGAIELGVRFVASVEGTVTGIRFYKGPQNTGTHTGSLWTASGTLLATATFTNETTSGWQQVNFASPVSITAGTTYVASYHTTSGYYSATSGYFNTDRISGPLTAPAGNNGLYAYGSGGIFPTNSFNNANYWVDVVFDPTEPAANQAPVASADGGLTAFQGAPLAISAATLLANDSDPDGDALAITGVSGAAGGTAVLDAATQTITFTADGSSGAGSFTYAISDGRGGTGSASVSLAVDRLPVAVDDSGLQVDHNGTLTIAAATLLANDTDPDGDVLTITGVSGATGGIASYDSATQSVLFTPDSNYGGAASFTYTVSDGRGGTGNATVSLLVDRPPVAVNDSGIASVQGTPVVIAAATLLANDSDPEGDALTVTGIDDITGGSAIFDAQSQTVTFTADGSSGAGSFTYAVSDGRGGTSSAVVLIAVNRLPTLADDGGFLASRNAPLTIDAATLLANDSDADGDALTITGVGGATNGTVSYNAATQAITFTPANNYGGPASFTYTVSDGRGGSASASVSLGVNRLPTPTNDSGLLVSRNTPLTIGATTLLANDTDPDGDALTVTGVSGASGGSVSYNAATQAITFTPTNNYGGAASFTYTVSDGRGGSASASVALGVSRPPTAVADSGLRVSRNTPLTISATTLLANDTDPDGDALTITGVSGASGGSVSYNAATQNVTFTPTNNYGGAASFSYTISDGRNGTSTSTVSLNVNRTPSVNNDSGLTAYRSTARTIAASTLLANDTDPDGDTLTITGVSGASGGSVSYNAATQLVTFTPNNNYTGTASFTYTASDGRGLSDTATVSLNVVAPSTLFGTSTPSASTSSSTSSVELGMKFRASQDGLVTGIRFFKGSASNNGTHTGSLWTSTGTKLATTTFTNETSTGWQEASFATPVAITAGQTYVASYHANNGRYSQSSNYFLFSRTSGPLTAPSNFSSGGNGVFATGSGSLFPTQSGNGTNYWVDVVFQPQLAA